MRLKRFTRWFAKVEIATESETGRLVLVFKRRKDDRMWIGRDIGNEVYAAVITDLTRVKPEGGSSVMTLDGENWFSVTVAPVDARAVEMALSSGEKNTYSAPSLAPNPD